MGKKGILDELIQDIEKNFGKEAVSDMEHKIEGIEKLPSGSIAVDLALGGGYPKGRIIEISGPESSGKTTLAIHAMVEAQKEGGIVGFIDAEHAFDKDYAKNLGLDTSKDKWLISQPNSGEEALEITEKFIRSGLFTIIVIDSVAALTPQAEIDGAFGDAKMGLHARLMSQAMRKLVSIVHKTDTVVMFINQLRMKIGLIFGNPEVTTGGNALKFYTSQRIDIRRIGQNKEGEEVLSNRTRVKVIKNKVAPPYKKAEFDIVFGKGIDKIQEILEISVMLDIIKKSGSWFSYGETKLGQGAAGVKELLKDNPEFYEEVTKKIHKKLEI